MRKSQDQASDAEINLKPYQGLKLLEKLHRKKADQPQAEINLKPYQGLKLNYVTSFE